MKIDYIRLLQKGLRALYMPSSENSVTGSTIITVKSKWYRLICIVFRESVYISVHSDTCRLGRNPRNHPEKFVASGLVRGT
jgi:hypothetical protein